MRAPIRAGTRVLATGALLAGLAATAPAGAAVSVFGGGEAARECYLAAKHGRRDEAGLASCTTALDTHALSGKDYAGTLINRGVLYLLRGAYAEAERDLTAAISAEPTIGDGWVNRGAARIAAHRFQEGIADLDKGLELGSQEPEKAYYNRGLARERLDDVKGAYLDYWKAAELAPTWDAPKAELARFKVQEAVPGPTPPPSQPPRKSGRGTGKSGAG